MTPADKKLVDQAMSLGEELTMMDPTIEVLDDAGLLLIHLAGMCTRMSAMKDHYERLMYSMGKKRPTA